MFSSNRIKFIGISFFASLIFPACSFWQNAESRQNNSNKFAAEELKSEIPFGNKEPEVFQAEIVLTTYLNSEKFERTIKTARNGGKIRDDYPTGITFLQLSENERFLLEPEKKIYTQSLTNTNISSETSETLKDFLTTEWLNEKTDTKFENLGAENGLAKYRGKGENADSEIFIYVDENLKFPVKEEFYSINGEQKILVSATEIKNLKLEVDDKRFELPKDYKQLSSKEFQKAVREKTLNLKDE